VNLPLHRCHNVHHLYLTQTLKRKTQMGTEPQYIANSRSTRRAWAGMLRFAELTGANVEPRWESFGAFLDDVSYRPENTVLRRRDESQGFTANNCAWMPAPESNR
jgi:hypothetical protein